MCRNTIRFAGAALSVLFALSARAEQSKPLPIRIHGQSSKATISNLAPINSK